MLQCNISIAKSLITLFAYNICFLYMLTPSPPSLHHHLYPLTISVENCLALFCHMFEVYKVLYNLIRLEYMDIFAHYKIDCIWMPEIEGWHLEQLPHLTNQLQVAHYHLHSPSTISFLQENEQVDFLGTTTSKSSLDNLLIENVGTMLWYMEEAEMIQLFFSKIAGTALDLHKLNFANYIHVVGK